MRSNRLRPRVRIGAFAVATSMVIVACSSDSAVVSQLESDLADAATDNALMAEDLAATQQELLEASSSLTDAQSETALVGSELDAAREEVAVLRVEVADLKSTLRSSESASQRAVREAEQALKESEDQVQALMLVYDDDLSAARSELSKAAQEFACDYGAGVLETGGSSELITSNSVLSAFLASEAYSKAIAESESVASLTSLVSSPGDALNAPADVLLKTPAVTCWQAGDAKVNAALYEHQSILREAVLDAACTNGASVAYEGWDGYIDTAAFRSWELAVGDDYSYEYTTAIEERYGSLEAFLAIPPDELEAEDARCEADRDLIESKSSGTWNVGDEIKAGTWKAFDVSDCYWARLSENGDIRANHFGDGLRLSVNVSPSDGQFEISGCVFYYANP